MSLGWGFVGTGGIATTVADALQHARGGHLAAVASRTASGAGDFASRRPGAAAYGGPDAVERMLADPGVGAVYVATPHPMHVGPARAALEAGLPTLVEKPMTTSAAATESLVELARRRNTFLMEAYWTRFLPGTATLLALLAEGAIGDIVHLHADLGFTVPPTMRRMLDPALGGGSLLDLGPYTVGLAVTLLGEPSSVAAVGSLTAEGVDQEMCVALGFPSGAVAALTTSMRASHIGGARIDGTQGYIALSGPLFNVRRVEVHAAGRDVVVHEFDVEHGHRYMLEHVHQCIAAGDDESPLVTRAWSRAVADVLEESLSAVGVVRVPAD